MIDPVLLMVCIASTAIVALAGAVPKWRDPARFRASLEAFALLPAFALKPLSYMLPLLETAGALGLLFADTRVPSAVVLGALFTLFALALTINILRGNTDIDCGCSGFIAASQTSERTPRAIGWWHVARAYSLAILAACAVFPEAGRALVWFDYLSACACTLFAVAAWFTLDLLLANLPKLDSLRNS
ncbi:MauE/DoxX family redox-associated membrane protein [Caballeronia insecticola]|uniref:Methylamine utilization protein MauE n=1 Tax=Caballeronia insecticola TaxID=758793 RepID=R4WLP5_9BURK|nr:MauE/DoxX family redox-associated membrane protein [Caballeronia insecticola]BAN25419.1 methylamine utilization MauE [Caballeronia insecticola]